MGLKLGWELGTVVGSYVGSWKGMVVEYLEGRAVRILICGSARIVYG